MKKFKIYNFIALISGLLLVLVSVLVPIIKFNNFISQNGSIGIIGGAETEGCDKMKKYCCPYCGQEAFDLLIKLGLNTKFSSAPRCPFCKKVAFRNFAVGGHFLYSAILCLSAILTACGIFLSVKLKFNIGIFLFPIAFIAFYLLYNYYFCYFDRVQKDGVDEKIQLQLKETKNSWPDIRKGGIYKIGLLYPYDFATARDGYITAMVENITGDKLLLRVLSKPPTEYFELRGEVAIYCGSTRYAATVNTPCRVSQICCTKTEEKY